MPVGRDPQNRKQRRWGRRPCGRECPRRGAPEPPGGGRVPAMALRLEVDFDLRRDALPWLRARSAGAGSGGAGAGDALGGGGCAGGRGGAGQQPACR